MNNTTRCYPRTSLRQSDAAYGCAIERPPARIADRAVTLVLWVAVVTIILSICFQGAYK